jgi:hypothetical protein
MTKKVDKRTKAYKQSQGLGDTIEKITEVTGIKKATKFLFGEDCGCDERKEKLNKKYPYKRNVECLKQKEFTFLDRIYKANARVLSREDNKELYKVYNRVFNAKKVSTTCGSCVKSVLGELSKIYNEYVVDN